MLGTFRLLCDASSLYRSDSGSILGAIHVEVSGTPFPDAGWTDFSVVILGWWLDATGYFDRKRSAKLPFMDGAFSLRVTWKDSSTRTVECLADGRQMTALVAEADVDAVQFDTELRRAAAAVVEVCERHGWSSPDVTRLQSLVDRP